MGFKWKNSDDIPQSQDTWAERIALRREAQQEAREEGDAEYEAKATRRLDHALDNYTRDRNWG